MSNAIERAVLEGAIRAFEKRETSFRDLAKQHTHDEEKDGRRYTRQDAEAVVALRLADFCRWQAVELRKELR